MSGLDIVPDLKESDLVVCETGISGLDIVSDWKESDLVVCETGMS